MLRVLEHKVSKLVSQVEGHEEENATPSAPDLKLRDGGASTATSDQEEKSEKAKKNKHKAAGRESGGTNTKSNSGNSGQSEEMRKLQKKIDENTARSRTLRLRLTSLKKGSEEYFECIQELGEVTEESKQLMAQLEELQ